MSKLNGLYFKLGSFFPFSLDRYMYLPTKGWHFVENNQTHILDLTKCKIQNWNTEKINELLVDYDWLKIGSVITNGHNWGLLLDDEILNNIYNEDYLNFNSNFWIQIMKNKLVAEIFTQYQNYVNEKNTTITNYCVRTTEDDNEINQLLIPSSLYNKLTINQKHEIGWMHDWENIAGYYLELPTISYVPLLDSGYYLKLETNELIKKSNIKCNNILKIYCGILASETGSGKTISTIGLLSTDIKNNNHVPNLVIVTKNILYQWSEEFHKFCPELNVLVIENTLTWENLNFETLSNYNVVLTHRDMIYSQVKNHKKNYDKKTDFTKIYWTRIIFDEFHEIKLNQKLVSVFRKLKSAFKWGLTGTLNDMDLLNMRQTLTILGFNLINNKTNNLTEEENNIFKSFYYNAIRKNPRCVLPKIKFEKYLVEMPQLNKLIYKSENKANELCSHLTSFWQQNITTSDDSTKSLVNMIVNKRNEQILKLKTEMANILDPTKIANIKNRIISYETANDYFQEIIKILESDKFECPICMEEYIGVENIVITDCMHEYCRQCFDVFHKNIHNFCVMCKSIITSQNIIIHPKMKEKNISKIDKIIEAINEVKGEKIILFTQFTSLAEHIAKIFILNKISYVTLRGLPSEINISLNKFKNDKNIKVLIMSIEQSASGLNITEATHVYFAHPIFNLHYQDAKRQYMQCIGRSYRYGQKKNVNVKIFCTLGTIEEKLANHIEQIL